MTHSFSLISSFKKFYIQFLINFGFFKKFLLPKKEYRIFIFHEIKKKNFKKFEEVINYIKSKYEIIDPKKSFNLKSNSSQAIISFDDGYYSQYECVKKYLDKKNIKVIFFAIYDFMIINSKNKHKKFLKDNLKINPKFLNNKEFKNMSIKNYKLLIKNGHTIGAHTISQPNLKKISKKNCENEIFNSKYKISKKLGIKNLDNFAITFGGINFINPFILKICKKFYKSTYTGIRGSNNKKNNIYLRDNCDLNKEINEIKLIIDGNADLYYVFDRIKLKFYKYMS